MAPIYLAEKNIKGGDSMGPNIFKARDLAGYAPCTLSSLSIVGIPEFREVAYDGYYRNLDAFIYATNKGTRVFCDADGYTNDFKARNPIQIEHPNVAYVPKSEMKADQEDKLLIAIGGVSKQKVGKTTIYTTKNPDDRTLSGLIASQLDHFGSGPDAVTPQGYKAFLFIRDVISEFLATHTYSAFSEKDLAKEGPMQLLAMKHKKRSIPVASWNVSKKSRWDYVSQTVIDREDDGGMLVPLEDVPEGVAERAEWDKQNDNNILAVDISNTRNVVLKAKPSPFLTGANFGPASQVPGGAGLVFPYFPGMNTPDSLIFKTMTTLFFMRLLGENSKQVQAKYISMRRGFQSLATTTEGKVLAHMLAGVKMTMDAQARLYIIYDSEYRGFVLLGRGFSVIDGAQAYGPLDGDLFTRDLAAFNPHLQGLQEVLESMNLLMSHARITREDIYTGEELDTYQKIIGELEKINLEGADEGDQDDIKKLNRGLRKLSFFDLGRFRRIQPDSVESLLDQILNENIDTSEMPFMFSDYSLPYSNKLYRKLAAFGREAPSPWNATGSEILLKPGTVAQGTKEGESGSSSKKAKIDTIYANMPTSLIFAPKPIENAYKDWMKVIEKGAVRMDQKERARGYRCMEVKHEDTKKMLWGKLLKIGTLKPEGREEGKSEKSKGKQKAIETPDDILTLFK
jgi:hypothetical protein